MKTLKYIIALTLLIINSSLLIAQDNVYVTGGRTKVIQWKSAGDYSAYSLLFVVVDADDERIIQKDLTQTYALGYTTMLCTLYVSDTEDLAFDASYDYDIAAYGADTITVRRGLFNIIDPVQTSFNGTNLPEGVRVTTISLSNGSEQFETVMWDTTNNYWLPSGMSMQEVIAPIVESYLDTFQVQGGITVADVEDIVSDSLTNYIDKTSGQIITGSKTFANLYLRDTASVFYLQGDRFLHMYKDATAFGGNLFLGKNSGNFTLSPAGGVNTLASYNVGIGENTLQNLTTGQVNTAVGYNALMSVTTGITNTAVGYRALEFDTSGGYNTAVGYRSLNNLLSGVANTVMGYTAGNRLTTGNYNQLMGYEAGYGLTTATTTVGIGATTFHTGNITGGVAIGYGAGYWETDNQSFYIDNDPRLDLATQRANALMYGTFNGVSSSNQYLNLNANTSVKHNLTAPDIYLGQIGELMHFSTYKGANSNGYNLFIGGGGLSSLGSGGDNTLGSYNLSFGFAALHFNTTGKNNIAVGLQSLYNNTTGRDNISFGVLSLGSNTIGYNNIGIGSNALFSNTSGTFNTGIGTNALYLDSSGIANTAIGGSALLNLLTGGYNTSIGYQSGMYTNADANVESNSHSIFIGYYARSSANGNTNEIVIGNTSTGNGSNTVTLGNDQITDTYLRGILRNPTIDSLRSGLVTLPDSIIYTSEIAGKFNTADTTAFNSKSLTTSQLAYKLDKSDTSAFVSDALLNAALAYKFNTTDTSAFVSDALLSASLTYKLNVADSNIYATQNDLSSVSVEGDTSTYTLAQMDSLLALAGTALQIDDTTSTLATQYDLTQITAGADSTVFATKYYVDTEIVDIVNSGDARVPFMWAYLQLDTTGSVSNIVDKDEAEVSTLETSAIFGVSANDVVRVAVDSARFKVKYDLGGTPTWTDWLTSSGYYKDVDSAQVQHYSSSSNDATTLQRFYVSNDVDTFSVTTTAGGGGDTLGVNLLDNGDMELAFTGSNEWESKFGATVTRSTGEQVNGGTYSAKTVTAGGGTGIGHVNGIATVADSTYWCEGYYYVVSGNAEVEITFSGSGDAETVRTSVTNAWTYFKLTITATSSDYATLVGLEYGAGGNTTFYLDDVTIKRRLP